jgi:hypothetical protein
MTSAIALIAQKMIKQLKALQKERQEMVNSCVCEHCGGCEFCAVMHDLDLEIDSLKDDIMDDLWI